MQIAGLLLILLGLFTKMAALLASIPDALVGGILTMGISMIAGVAMSNLQVAFQFTLKKPSFRIKILFSPQRIGTNILQGRKFNSITN